jgi:hypothetical protein
MDDLIWVPVSDTESTMKYRGYVIHVGSDADKWIWSYWLNDGDPSDYDTRNEAIFAAMDEVNALSERNN